MPETFMLQLDGSPRLSECLFVCLDSCSPVCAYINSLLDSGILSLDG